MQRRAAARARQKVPFGHEVHIRAGLGEQLHELNLRIGHCPRTYRYSQSERLGHRRASSPP